MISPFYKIDVLSYQKDKENRISSDIKIGPLKKGVGLTLGNALRRTVLLELEGVAITGVHLYNMINNFGTVDALREDIFELSLNLQNVVLSSDILPFSCEGKISKRGPKIITAEDILLPENVNVVNPHQYIGCVNENCSIDIILDIASGKGYNLLDTEDNSLSDKGNETLLKKQANTSLNLKTFQTSSESSSSLTQNNQTKSDLDYMKVDSVFAPVESFTFQVEAEPLPELENHSNIGFNEPSEYLHVYLTTNGSISPQEAINKGAKHLIELLKPLEGIEATFQTFFNSRLTENHEKTITNTIVDSLTQDATIEENKAKVLKLTTVEQDLINNYPIEKLKISKRILNSLKRENYTKIGDLIQTSQETFKNMKNFGKKSFSELKAALNELGVWID